MTPATKNLLRSLSLAALAPAAVAAVIYPFLGLYVFVVAFALAAIVGYPAFLILKRYAVANGWTATLLGLAIGAGSHAYSAWPLKYPALKTTASRGSGASMVYTMIDGVPTQLMWNEYLMFCAIFGVVGAVAGWIFWYQMSKPTAPTPEKGDDRWKYLP